MKRREDFKSANHRAAFDKGYLAWFDKAAVPYRDSGYAHAWRCGWKKAQADQDKVRELGEQARLEMRAINDPRASAR